MEINLADSAFILICSSFVFLMTTGLAFFYGGMVRRKNVLNTMMSSFSMCGLASIMWVLIGYSLSFGNDFHGIIGGFNFFGLVGVGAEPNVAYANNISQLLFAIFQMMFAIITPGAGFVPIWSSIVIGALVSPICFFFVGTLKAKFGYDDALDAFGCHGVGGIGVVSQQDFLHKNQSILQHSGMVFFSEIFIFLLHK